MDTGFVKRIGDVIIERVGPPSSSMTPPPPPEGGPGSQPPGGDRELPFGLPPVMSGIPMPDYRENGPHEGEGAVPRLASSDPPMGPDDVHDDIHDALPEDDPPDHADARPPEPVTPGDMDEEDIVPDFPDEDLNEDHVPPMAHDDEVDDPDRGDLIDPPIEDDLDEGGGDESDADVLAGLKDGAGNVALMESEDLLREIKPEPMDCPDEEEQNEEGEEGGDEREEESQKDDDSGKRERESDNEEEQANKKKKSEEEDSDNKKFAINFRKNIREVMDETQLDEATLAAQRQEAERLRRVQDQQKYLREMQMQRQMQIQKNRASRMMSFLQGGSGSASLIKASSSSQGGPFTSSKPNTVVVKLGSGGPPQLLNKKVLEAIRGGKSSPSPPDSRAGLTRILNKHHMVTPSVSIAPVKAAEKKAFVNPDVVTISSSDDEDDDRPLSATTGTEIKVKEEPEDDDDDDCIVISEPSDEEEEEEVDTNNSGMHTNDLFNCPDEQGRVLINVGKQEGESEIFLAPQVARVIKPHQIGGIRFLFDNIIESVERFKTSTGFGCILAHSMGLGKTLQVVSFCDIFLRETPGRTIMCIMPINTLQNWMAEFNMWLPMDASTCPLAAQGEVRPRDFQIFVLNDLHKTIASRARVVAEWQKVGGVLLIGYEMYRQLSLRKGGRGRKGKKKNPAEDVDDVKNKPHLENMHEALVKPGPDLVICDEGHRIKNSHASISHALKQIRTKRRVVLTGYPLQNNLLEYWCMVDFVRPNYLGTKTEFSNMFERPIQNGQCIDSTPQDIRLMRYRAHVLHSLLEGFVQRRSHSVLRNSLPQKEEYVLLVRMTPFQRTLYDTFMNEVVRTKAVPNPLKAFAVCCKIWNHPDILYNFLKKKELDELQDLDLEETANLNPNQTVDPNSPRRGGETRGRKGKGGKKAPAVPIKPAATVPPTNAQPDVKNDSQNPNFDFNRDQQNFSQSEGCNPPQGDFDNFNPNLRPGNYFQNNYNSYQNFPGQPEGNYNYQGPEFNNYNNYYQGGSSSNFPNNLYPQVKKEEEFQDKKEEIKFSQQKALSGGQVVYNSPFGPNQFEPKKEFPQYNEWGQVGQQNYSSFQPWSQDQPDQKPKTEELMPNYTQQGFPQNPNFQAPQTPSFPPQNFGEQPSSGMQRPQNPANFGSNPGFTGSQNSPIPTPSQDYQQSGYPQSNAQQNKACYNAGFENPQNPPSNPNSSGFPQSGSSQMNQPGYPQNFNQPNPQSTPSHNNPPAPQNFVNLGAPSGTQPNQQGFSTNYSNQAPCASSGFPAQGPNQGYQQNFPPNPNPNDGFQQNFGNQSGPSNPQSFGNGGHNPSKNQNCPPDYSSPNQPNIPTSQPSGYPLGQPSSGFSNFPGSQPPCSSAAQQYHQTSDVQSTYTMAGSSQGFQNLPPGGNPQQSNPDFYQSFPTKNETGGQTSGQSFPPHFQGNKPVDAPQNIYSEQNSQGYFNSPQQNLFRPHQDTSLGPLQPLPKHESIGRQSQPHPQMFENFPGSHTNLSNTQPNQPNQNYGVNSTSPVKNLGFRVQNQPEMGNYGAMGSSTQPVDNFGQKPPQASVPGPGTYGMDGNKGFPDPTSGFPSKNTAGGYGPKPGMDVPDMGYQHAPSKDTYGTMGSKNTQEHQMHGNFGPMGAKGHQDQSNVSYGAPKTQDPMIGSYGSGRRKKMHTPPMSNSGYMGPKNPTDSSMSRFAPSGVSKTAQDSQMGYAPLGPKDAPENFGQMGNKNPIDMGTNYGRGGLVTPPKNVPSSGPRDQSKGFNASHEQQPMGGFGAPMHEQNINSFGAAKNSQDSMMGGNYGRAPSEQHGPSGSYTHGQNPQGQPVPSYGMGSMPQESAGNMGNFGSFDMKNAQQDMYGQMGQTQPGQQSSGSSMGGSKPQDDKSGYNGSGKMPQSSCYGPGGNSIPPNQGYQYSQEGQGSMAYGGQMDMGQYRGPNDQMNPRQSMPFGNQMAPGQMMPQMNQQSQNMGGPNQMSQIHPSSQPMPGNVPPAGQNQGMPSQNQSGNAPYMQNQGPQADSQNPYYQNQNFNFDQPGTSFDMKEKRGMSCQTEFEKDPDKEDEDGRKDDDKKDDDKKVGEVQVALPAGKGGKEEVGIPYDWATELLKGYVPGDIHASAKMTIFFCILEESIALGDRILVFSQSLFTLNLMEELLQRHNIPGKEEKWARNLNYYRLDGSTAAIEREKLINEFNSNPKLHLFMVSTRAGSLGINLVGANRVIVFDASWNPCHDTQAVCRVYRYGQKKPCFVYRVVTDNCLEKKIYDRQINKQGMSDRVVDECNPDAHLSIKEVTSLCWDDKADDTEVKDFTDIQDQYIDVVIQKVLQQHSKLLSKEPFQHESLLVDRTEKKLSQAEKRLAKRSYELEKQASGTNRPLYQNNIVSNQGGIIRRGSDKPMASVRPMQSELGSQLIRGESRQRGWIPASVWQRQGMSAQEMTLPLDVVIPTNAPDRSSIVLKAGQKVMVLKSPKGIYMQLENGKIIAIRTAFKPGNKEVGAGPKKSTGTGPEPGRRNVSVIPSNLRNNSAVSITPRGPVSSGSGTGPGRVFSQGNRPVRAVGPSHRSPVSVTVTKKRPVAFDHASHVVANPSPIGSRMSSKSDESEGCDNSVSPARPPPSPHHDSRDSMASSSSQYGSYSNSSRSTPVLPSFARDVSITPYSSKDHRGGAAPSNIGVVGSIPSGYRDPGGGYPSQPRTEVSITPFSQDVSRDEARKEYDGGGSGSGGGCGPAGPLPPPPHDYRQESRPFASVSLDSSHPYRHDPLGHGESGGSRGIEAAPDSSGGERNKRAFQPYPTPYPPPPPTMDKGPSVAPGLYNPYHMDSKGYDDKGHGAMMRPHLHAEAAKLPPHPLYHHRPPPPHEPDTRAYRSDKPLYHPPRPDSEKQFQPPEPEKSYLSSQKSYMQSEKPFMQNEKPYLPAEKPHLPSEKPVLPSGHLPSEKSDKGYIGGGKDGGDDGKMAPEPKPAPPMFPLRPEAKPAPLPPHAPLPYLPPREPYAPHDPPPPPPPFYSSYPPPYGPNPFTAAAVSRSSFYPPPPTYYPPFPTYPQHPPPP